MFDGLVMILGDQKEIPRVVSWVEFRFGFKGVMNSRILASTQIYFERFGSFICCLWGLAGL